jgi:hypothetical protein
MNAMNDLPLTCHHSTMTDTITRFTASVERDADGWLCFRYIVHGAVNRIALPAHVAPQHADAHTDNLWRHTCFEAFIAAEDDPAYVECNFAPSHAWATYRFARYRTRMTALVPVEPPRITLHMQEPVRPEPVEGHTLRQAQAERVSEKSLPLRSSGGLVLEARIHLGEFADRAVRIGLTAVIEDQAGSLSYWALRHPRSKPDFHHRGGFILRLATPEHTGKY